MDEDKKKVYDILNNNLKNLSKFCIFYENFQKDILDLIEIRSNVFKRKVNPIFNYISLREEGYLDDVKRRDVFSMLESKIFKLEKVFHLYLISFDEMSYFFLNLKLKKIDERTLRKLILEIQGKQREMFKLFSFNENFTLNDYLIKKASLNRISKEIISLKSQMLSLIFEGLWYRVDVNFSEIKKLNISDLKVGDILVLRKEDSKLTSFRKLAKTLLHSNFIHSAIIYKIQNSKVYLFEALAYNDKKTTIEEIEISSKYSYVVLRPRKKLTLTQLKKLNDFEESNLNNNYSFLKVFGAFFERNKEQYFENSSLSFFRKKNPSNFLSGVFCSEIVARGYREIGIQIGITDDDSNVSPVDILNSPQLRVIGYFKTLDE